MAEETSTQNSVVTGGAPATTSPGHTGLPTQVAGEATTVSAAATATGGIGPGNFIEVKLKKDYSTLKTNTNKLCRK